MPRKAATPKPDKEKKAPQLQDADVIKAFRLRKEGLGSNFSSTKDKLGNVFLRTRVNGTDGILVAVSSFVNDLTVVRLNLEYTNLPILVDIGSTTPHLYDLEWRAITPNKLQEEWNVRREAKLLDPENVFRG